MDSLRNLYKIGTGPSSSHTMGPKKAALIFKEKNKEADRFYVELYGSLAATGKGHLTDFIIRKTLGNDKCEIVFKPEVDYTYHPNGMKMYAYKENQLIDEWLVFSVGGGEIKNLDEERSGSQTNVYKHKNMAEILEYCDLKNISFYDYVIECEGQDIIKYGDEVLTVMFNTVEKGLVNDGKLPVDLNINRRAK